MSDDVSTFRLYLMRTGYLVNLVVVGLGAWPALVDHTGAWDPVRAAAFCLYAALSALSALGIRYPLRMVPLLLFQLLYKVVFLIAVAAPAWPALRGATREMVAGTLIDLIVIPWPHVFEHYVRNGGDRWGGRARAV